MDRTPTVRSLGLRPWRRRGAVAALLVIAALAFLAWPRPSVAEERDMRAARTKYPNIVGTQLDACGLCHNSPQYSLDPYGRDFGTARRDFATIEPLDSDGDGFNNYVEIQALTFPGKADSHPTGSPPPPTTVVTATATVAVTATPTIPPSATPTPTTAASVTATVPASATPTAGPTGLPYHLRLPWAAKSGQ